MSAAILFHNDKSIGYFVSLLLHVSMLVLGFFFLKPIQYAVEQGSGGIEVSLTAAPAEQTSILQAEAPQLKAEIKEEAKQAPAVVKAEHKGDGSSALPGKDATTFYSAGGAIAAAQPNYLRNPAPPYPWEARQKGWQGIVILKVFVDKSGHPVKIEEEQTSGHAILDEAAVKTVKSWSFYPAKAGNLPVDSFVRIPIRFELKEQEI